MRIALTLLLLFFSTLWAGDVTFMVSHPAPLEHFLAYAKVLKERSIPYYFVASGYAKDKLTSLHEPYLACDDLSKDDLAVLLRQDRVLIFDSLIGSYPELLEKLPKTKKVLYYDNFEPFVAGGYSTTMSRLIKLKIDALLLASSKLEKETLLESETKPILYEGRRYAIGFYPIEETFSPSQLPYGYSCDLSLYLGAANEHYLEEGLPFFLNLLKQLPAGSERTILYQMHPRSCDFDYQDLKLLEEARPLLQSKGIYLIYSPFSLNTALQLSKRVFYFQTSLTPRVLLAHLALYKIAKEPGIDFAVKEAMATWVDSPELLQGSFSNRPCRIDRHRVYEAIGYDSGWPKRFLSIIEELIYE